MVGVHEVIRCDLASGSRGDRPVRRAIPLAAIIGLAGAIACGGSDAGGDAPDAMPSVPDAATCDMTLCGDDCVDTSTSTDHCGGCFQPCTPAQDCDQNCQCPSVAVSEDFILRDMDDEMLAPTIIGIGVFADGQRLNALVIGFADPGTLTNTDIDLAAGEPPFVAIGYDIDTATRQYRSAFRAQTGTLNLTRRCALGVAGTVTGADLVEVEPDSDPPVAIPDGCTATIESIAFDFGDACE